MHLKCKFCERDMKTCPRAYLSNPFCGHCLDERLEASGAIDLRDNSRWIDLGNGYHTIEPIDTTKLFKAKRDRL